MASVSSDGGRSGDGFHCVVLGGSLGQNGREELYYGTDIVTGSLKEEAVHGCE